MRPTVVVVPHAQVSERRLSAKYMSACALAECLLTEAQQWREDSRTASQLHHESTMGSAPSSQAAWDEASTLIVVFVYSSVISVMVHYMLLIGPTRCLCSHCACNPYVHL